VAPIVAALIDSGLPSGRYRVADLAKGLGPERVVELR
jgi:hypothetical protein